MLCRLVLTCVGALVSLAPHFCLAQESRDRGLVLHSKIATDGDFITLPVKVGGQWRTFMVDTGTSVTTFHAPFVKELKKADEAARARVPLQEKIPNLYAVPKMTLTGTISGEIEFPAECAVMSDDLTKVRTSSKQSIDGVLGMDLLERYVMKLDLAAGTLQLWEPQPLSKAKHDATLKIDMIMRRPCLQIASGDVEFWALIDTGALLTLKLERKVYDHVGGRGKLMQWPFEVEHEGKKVIKYASEGWLEEVKVGPLSVYFQSVDVDDSISLLGLCYWRRYRCTFDFPNEQVYLDKGPLFDVVDDSHHAGIYVQIAADDEKAREVAYVIKDCWADRNGVRVGDRLVQIDGKGVESDSVQTIYRRMSFHHDRSCELRLVRDGKEIRIVIPATGLSPARNSE